MAGFFAPLTFGPHSVTIGTEGRSNAVQDPVRLSIPRKACIDRTWFAERLVRLRVNACMESCRVFMTRTRIEW